MLVDHAGGNGCIPRPQRRHARLLKADRRVHLLLRGCAPAVRLLQLLMLMQCLLLLMWRGMLLLLLSLLGCTQLWPGLLLLSLLLAGPWMLLVLLSLRATAASNNPLSHMRMYASGMVCATACCKASRVHEMHPCCCLLPDAGRWVLLVGILNLSEARRKLTWLRVTFP